MALEKWRCPVILATWSMHCIMQALSTFWRDCTKVWFLCPVPFKLDNKAEPHHGTVYSCWRLFIDSCRLYGSVERNVPLKPIHRYIYIWTQYWRHIYDSWSDIESWCTFCGCERGVVLVLMSQRLLLSHVVMRSQRQRYWKVVSDSCETHASSAESQRKSSGW